MRRPKILLIEQERDDGDACAADLKAQGARVIRADAARALLDIAKAPPDAALMIRLPEALPRGEYCRTLRLTAGARPMAILVVVPARMEVLRTHCREQGADGFIEPPPSADAVLAVLKSTHILRAQSRTLRHGALEMRLDDAKLFLSGERVPMRPALFNLLRIFLENPDRLLSHGELVRLTGREHVARPHLAVAERIRSLRESLSEAGVDDVVRPVGSRGYALGPAWRR